MKTLQDNDTRKMETGELIKEYKAASAAGNRWNMLKCFRELAARGVVRGEYYTQPRWIPAKQRLALNPAWLKQQTDEDLQKILMELNMKLKHARTNYDVYARNRDMVISERSHRAEMRQRAAADDVVDAEVPAAPEGIVVVAAEPVKQVTIPESLYNGLMEELTAKNYRVKELEGEVEHITKANAGFAASNDKLEAAKRELELNLNAEKERKNQMVDLYKKADEGRAEARAKVKELEAQLAALTTRCSDRGNRLDKLEGTLATANTMLDSRGVRLNQLDAELKTTRDSVVSLKDTISELKSELNAQKSVSDCLRKEHAELLAVLKRIVNQAGIRDRNIGYNDFADALNEAEAAIAKAEGK